MPVCWVRGGGGKALFSLVLSQHMCRKSSILVKEQVENVFFRVHWKSAASRSYKPSGKLAM